MPKGKVVKAEEAIALLARVEEAMALGLSVAQACRQLGISIKSYYRWRNLYAGKTVDDAVRSSELRKENAKLRRAIADLVVENRALKDVVEGKF